MKASVAVAKEADAKKRVSPTKSDNSILRVRNEPERQLGSLRDAIGNIRRDGDTPSVESIATELSSTPSAQRASVLLALQRTHGNRYVQQVVAGIQAKLKVSAPGDIYEQEADRVADAVMRMPEPRFQRLAEEEEVEELKEEKEAPVMATGFAGGMLQISDNLQTPLNLPKSGGYSLPEQTRIFMENRLGVDFRGVRVHADSDAAQISRELNAAAFTSGRDIYFGAGMYSPATSTGKRLLAHELTHVVQQGKSGHPPNMIFRRIYFTSRYRSIRPPRFEVSGTSTEDFTGAQLCRDEERGCRLADAIDLGWSPVISGRSFRFFGSAIPSTAPAPNASVLVKLTTGTARGALGVRVVDHGCCSIRVRR